MEVRSLEGQGISEYKTSHLLGGIDSEFFICGMKKGRDLGNATEKHVETVRQ